MTEGLKQGEAFMTMPGMPGIVEINGGDVVMDT